MGWSKGAVSPPAGCQISQALPDPWSLVAVQIDSAHLSILNDSRIQDGHHEEWEDEYVAGVVRREVRRLLINTVRIQTLPHLQLSFSISTHRMRMCCQYRMFIRGMQAPRACAWPYTPAWHLHLLTMIIWAQIITFDPAGVTGHKNHKGCHDGVRCARFDTSILSQQTFCALSCQRQWDATQKVVSLSWLSNWGGRARNLLGWAIATGVQPSCMYTRVREVDRSWSNWQVRVLSFHAGNMWASVRGRRERGSALRRGHSQQRMTCGRTCHSSTSFPPPLMGRGATRAPCSWTMTCWACSRPWPHTSPSRAGEASAYDESKLHARHGLSLERSSPWLAAIYQCCMETPLNTRALAVCPMKLIGTGRGVSVEGVCSYTVKPQTASAHMSTTYRCWLELPSGCNHRTGHAGWHGMCAQVAACAADEVHLCQHAAACAATADQLGDATAGPGCSGRRFEVGFEWGHLFGLGRVGRRGCKAWHVHGAHEPPGDAEQQEPQEWQVTPDQVGRLIWHRSLIWLWRPICQWRLILSWLASECENFEGHPSHGLQVLMRRLVV